MDYWGILKIFLNNTMDFYYNKWAYCITEATGLVGADVKFWIGKLCSGSAGRVCKLRQGGRRGASVRGRSSRRSHVTRG